MPAGDRKMPEPIVIPTTSAMELQRPRVRGRRSVCGATVLMLSRSLQHVGTDDEQHRCEKESSMNSGVNVAAPERWASALGGAALTAYALRQLKDRSPAGAALAAAGTALMYRGATGHCPMYAAAGIDTAHDFDETRHSLAGPRGVNVEEVFTLMTTPEELYAFWRNVEVLPRFMEHLVEVRQISSRRSHWVAKAPAGRTVEWDAEIINDIPGELIAWRTLPGDQLARNV